MGQQAFKDAFLAEDMALLAAERIDEGFKAETTGVKGLDRVPPKPLLLRPVSKLSLLIVREEGEIVVVLRVPLRHLLSLAKPLP